MMKMEKTLILLLLLGLVLANFVAVVSASPYIPEEIKIYIANTYCGGTVHLEGVNDFGEGCMLNNLRTPLPSGYTHDTLCTAEVLNWCANNMGYTASGGGVSTAVKDYIANKYCGGTTTLAGIKDFTEGCMLNTLRTPLPAGETHDTICVAEVLDWAALNLGYTATTTPTTVSTAVKDYIANIYCGGVTTLTGVKDFNEDCALNKLRTPLPAGYTHDTICVAEVLDWAYANIGYTPSGPTASAMTWYVDDDDKADFTSIQDAINTASAGDIIIVRDGTYIENVDVDNSLAIQSENGPASTIVQAANSSDHVFNVCADYVNISGFTVKGAGYLKNGIYLYYVNHCGVFDNNVSNNSFGIMLDYSSNNDIIDNKVSNSSVGILLKSDCYNNVIRNNNLYLINEIGVVLAFSSNNTLSNNSISYSKIVGMLLAGSCNNTIRNNNICQNGDGISIVMASNNNIYLNHFINNTNSVGDYYGSALWNSPSKITYIYDGNAFTNYLGNYWSDYEGTDADGDGIGDSSYSIDSKSDDYPLMQPFENYITRDSMPKAKDVATVARHQGDVIYVTYMGGPDQAMVTRLDTKINGKNVMTDFASAIIGATVSDSGYTGTNNHVVVIATFSDGTAQVILDMYC
ncbi:MAG: right-handed parallel beta-helix repeat-containing protein [Methanophagales archaeon]|nr:right-handed parallel beta-helix repeat-containing protein [Methanophagales archaeon]